MKPFPLAALAAACLSACGEAAAPEAAPEAVPVAATVGVTEAWCRPTPNGARAGACYVTLTANQDDRLVSVATPVAASAQIHDMVMEGGMMKMSEMTGGLPLPAQTPVSLAPGGRHLMLTGLTGPLAAGEQAPLTLRFEKAAEVTVQAAIRQPPVADSHGGG